MFSYRVAEGIYTDEDIQDPISNIISLLNEKKDRALMQKWGIWLVKIDPERGLKVSLHGRI
jgi:vacuolar protein sorting-associated protein 3